jgi:hypothetical protein
MDKVSEDRPGPPWVMIHTTSNVLSPATSARPTTTAVSGRIIGQMILENRVQPPAPSTLAASMVSRGMDWRPTTNSSRFTPMLCQVCARIITIVFSGAVCRNEVCAPGRWSVDSKELRAPLSWSTNPHTSAVVVPEIA